MKVEKWSRTKSIKALSDKIKQVNFMRKNMLSKAESRQGVTEISQVFDQLIEQLIQQAPRKKTYELHGQDEDGGADERV